jgi:alpha-L-rhamnosidase
MMPRPVLTFFALCSLAVFAHGVEAAVSATNLRCEYLANPLGIDVLEPRLSWILQSVDRGQRQTAYQVLVATSREKLDANQANLWDTGRVESDRTNHIVYAGKPLQTRMQCFWKVRAWDKDGKPSAWSEPASWSMGLLKPADWASQWIGAGVDASKPPVTPHNGYHSQIAPSADVAKWVTVDLGQTQNIDAVRVHPARPFDYTDTPGFLFPVRFKIETAQNADFSDTKTVVDQTGADVPNPGIQAPVYRFPPAAARYVRLTATRLARRDASNYAFALAEMQVLAGAKNVAAGAHVTALDSIELGGWAKGKLVDHRLLPDRGTPDVAETPSTMLRKEFEVGRAIKRATVSVTGLGLYELHVNGHKVGDHLLAPEWTRYSRRIQYQTFDVTDLLREGKNAVGAQLGGGWWAGPLMAKPPMLQARFCLLMRLDVELADGVTQTIVTDPTWQSTTDGPVRRAGIYFGETYDATKEMPGWDLPGFVATGWRPVLVLPHPDEAEKARLVAQCNEPIRAVQELKPIKMTEPKPGVYVFDMGQNMVGWCRLKANAPAGTKITLRHAEMLKDDGTIYTDNLRGAAQVAEYTWRGGEATLEPHFTYYGFRYVELTGLPSRPNNDALVGRVIHSAAPDTGRFTCSNELINKIMHCVEWTQRANLYSAPTDCPQRTEREGWMGDIQAFSQTAIFNMDMAGFFTKWVPDIRDSQADDGRYPDVAPHVSDPNQGFSGVPAWGDAGTVVPWRMYQNYADRRMLDQHFESARRWVEFIHTSNPNLLWQKNRGNDYNDWLNGDTLVLKDYPRGISAVPNEVFATAFFAHSTEILAKMAGVLGRTDDATKYGKLFDDIKKAFNQTYVAPDGRIRGDTQAGYVLALNFNLLDPPLRPRATQHLLDAIKKYKDHPSTGIQTTHRMLLELSRNGHHDEAWRLLNLRTVPSWGYMVDMGATTIWERWDGYVKGRGFQDPGMNSFNHWAFGSVGEWIWRELAGIQPDEEQPGFKHFTIRPRPCPGLTWAKGEYGSIRGRILSDWRQEGNRFSLHVVIPPNTTATVCLPAKDAESVMEGAQPVAKAPGVQRIAFESAHAVLQVHSGTYRFESTMP